MTPNSSYCTLGCTQGKGIFKYVGFSRWPALLPLESMVDASATSAGAGAYFAWQKVLYNSKKKKNPNKYAPDFLAVPQESRTGHPYLSAVSEGQRPPTF